MSLTFLYTLHCSPLNHCTVKTMCGNFVKNDVVLVRVVEKDVILVSRMRFCVYSDTVSNATRERSRKENAHIWVNFKRNEPKQR